MALEKDESHSLQFDDETSVTAEELEEKAREESRLLRNLRTVNDYFKEKNVVALVRRRDLPEAAHIDWQLVSDY